VAALRGRRAHPDLTTFRLCQEFGWTPLQVRAQPAGDIEKLVLVLNELEQVSTLVPAEDDGTTTILIGDD